MLVDYGVGPGGGVGMSHHVVVEFLGGAGDVPLPQSLVVEEHQRLKVHWEKILGTADLSGLHRHGQVVGQDAGIHHIGQGRHDVHGHKTAQHVVGVEVHVRGVGCVAAVQLELVGHISLLLENHRYLVIRQLGVDLIGNGLHNPLVPIVPDSDCDGHGRGTAVL